MRVVNQNLPTINKILHDLAPDLRPIRASKVSEHLANGHAWNAPSESSKAGRR